MPPETEDEKTLARRKALAEGVGFVLNAYLQSNSLLNPAGLAASALNQYEQNLTKPERDKLHRQEAEMRAMMSQIENLKATFEDGRLIVHLDKASVLGLLERSLRKSLAVGEAAMTATFKLDMEDGEKDHEGELVLASRSIFLKFVPNGKPMVEFAISYLERARSMNPSEYWLLVPRGGELNIPFEPIFSENKVSRGRLRILELTTFLGELVGERYDVQGAHEADGGFRFVISKKQVAPPAQGEAMKAKPTSAD